jgi:hypothetical protein
MSDDSVGPRRWPWPSEKDLHFLAVVWPWRLAKTCTYLAGAVWCQRVQSITYPPNNRVKGGVRPLTWEPSGGRTAREVTTGTVRARIYCERVN